MDLRENRKKVMRRSIQIGHCVCDPRKPCPCPLFNEKNICTCAGEKALSAMSDIRDVKLTTCVRNAGCASKIGQKDLHEVLGRLPKVEDPRLLVGMATADDAGVFQISKDLAIVQTVDVFTPGVDDPYVFGRIAACNSLSDVYAMGGVPVTALSVIGFPVQSLPLSAMTEMIRGGMDVLKEAGTILLGGHSINDEEVKFGFAVTGTINPAAIVTNAGVQVGDVLVLTKPLGTGIISLARQIGRASQAAIEAAEKSMTTLNRAAAEIMVARRAHAGTDVTGFGLLGHLAGMVRESGVTAEIWCDTLPLLPDTLELAQKGVYSGANEKNADYVADRVTFAATVPEEIKAILYDAQTSGGLLMAIPAEEVEAVVADLKARGCLAAAVVGKITERSDGMIKVAVQSAGATPELGKGNIMANEVAGETGGCCAHSAPTPGNTGRALDLFGQFLGAAMAPGAVDIVTKELMAIALGLAVHCVPCSRMHIRKAKEMGISKAEIEEAAALAVAFSGCRALMLWNEVRKDLLSE